MDTVEDVPADDVGVWLGSIKTVPGKEVNSNRKKCGKKWKLRTGAGAWAAEKRDAFLGGEVGAALDRDRRPMKWDMVDVRHVTLPRARTMLKWKRATAVATARKSVDVAVTEANTRQLFSSYVASIVERAWVSANDRR